MIPLPKRVMAVKWSAPARTRQIPNRLARIGGHVAATRAVVMNAVRVIEWRPVGAT